MLSKLIESLREIPNRFEIKGDEQELIDSVVAAKVASEIEIDDKAVEKLRRIVRRSEFSASDKRQLGLIINNLSALRPMRKSKAAI